MRYFEFFDRNDIFRSQDKIKEWIKTSNNYAAETPQDSQIFLFFKTSKQRTYLVATEVRLYCILDDSRTSEPHINWSMGKKELVENGALKISISARNKGKTSGFVDIGEKHKDWLYSKDLFRSKAIEEEMKSFILSAMG